MKALKLILYIAVSVLSTSLWANDEEQRLLDQASQAYANAAYDTAIIYYENLLAKEVISADVHYNLGNAYFKNQELAQAILHYEKALKYEPGHEDAAFNLEIANQKTIDRIESIPELFIYRWWKSIFNLMSMDAWAKLGVFLLLLALTGLCLYWFMQNLGIRKLGLFSGLITLTLALVCWFMAARQNHYFSKVQYAIITDPTVSINSSPSAGSSKLFVLHEGSKVLVEEANEEWLKISLANGNEGWIKKESLAEI